MIEEVKKEYHIWKEWETAEYTMSKTTEVPTKEEVEHAREVLKKIMDRF